ncbi:MAG: M20/M25/M40 family metallo-hydrolase [Candidatus Izemoplasmataceae bacterium]
MKIAIVYNRESQAVINLFGLPNKEKYGMETINLVKTALVEKGHQVRTFEGDKNIIRNLETFMPRVISGERPGLVFNLSYGIQGRGRYMHIPGILEMLGIPYVGSSPETHAIALDKVITKMILLQRGIPTPRFSVLETPEDRLQETLRYPLIVKPKSEAVSYGLRIVKNEAELLAGVENIYSEFKSPTLVEEYIDGREVNVGLLGNNPVRALPPLELVFTEGEKIFTFEDKTKRHNERVESVCPADLPEALSEKVKNLAIKTFKALGCFDSARVDFRIDKAGNPYVLEVNSMASLGKHASYVKAATVIGLPYNKLVQAIIQVATERYFGVNEGGQPKEAPSEANKVFTYLTQNRDQSERELKNWTNFHTSSDDAVSKQAFIDRLERRLERLGIHRSPAHTDGKSHWFWHSKKGFEEGVVFVVPFDIPGTRGAYPVPFRKEPERLFGEGIASSRAGLVSVLRAFDALHRLNVLKDKAFGLFVYGDEGYGMRYSAEGLRRLSKEAGRFIVMHPSYNMNKAVHQRRGAIKLKVLIEGKPLRVGTENKPANAMTYVLGKLTSLEALSKENKLLTISLQDLTTTRYSMLIPHKVTATIYITYVDGTLIKDIENKVQKLFKDGAKGITTHVEKLEERPPFVKSVENDALIEAFAKIAGMWNIPFASESTLLPSAGGIIPPGKAVLCGMAPGSKKLYTPEESINRTEWVQKTMILAQYLLSQ